MNPLVLAVLAGQLGTSAEAARPPVDASCRICLRVYVHNLTTRDGRQLIRNECDFTPDTLKSMRARQQQIATEGTYTAPVYDSADWGIWYPAHRIESVEPVLQPPCI